MAEMLRLIDAIETVSHANTIILVSSKNFK